MPWACSVAFVILASPTALQGTMISCLVHVCNKEQVYHPVVPQARINAVIVMSLGRLRLDGEGSDVLRHDTCQVLCRFLDGGDIVYNIVIPEGHGTDAG